MPESRRGPFSFDLLNYTSNAEYILTLSDFNADNGEILEVIAAGVVLVGDGTADSSSSAAAKTPTAHGFYVDSLTSPTKITLVTNIASDKQVTIRRLSNRSTASVDFAPGSVIREQDLDNSTNQTLHVAQEAIDIALLSIIEDGLDGKFDGESKVIKNLADGVADNDAVNIGQLEVHDTTITGYQTTTLGYKEDAEDYKLEANDWADKTDGQVKIYTDNVATGGDLGYSAKHYSNLSAASETAVIGVANTVSLVHDDLRDLYLGAGTTTKASADACTLTGAVWAKGKNLITGLTVASGAVTVGQKLTVDGGEDSTGFPTTTEVQILAWSSGTSTITINQIFSASNATTPDLTGAGLGLYAAYTNGPSTDNDGSTLIDGALYYDSTIDSLMVYDLGATTWLQIKPNTSQQANIDTVAGQITPTNNVATVAGKATEIGLLGALDTEIGLLGTGPMANSTDGDIKVVADLDTEVGLLGALDTEIGLLGTPAMAHATTGNLAKLGAGYDGTATQSGTTTNLAQINTVAAGIANVNNFANRYRVAANADLPLPSLDGGDLYFNTDTNELNVYNATTSAWAQATPNQDDIDAINIVAGNIIYQEDLGSIATAVTTSSVTNEIGKVAALEDQIERLGTVPMATATTGSIALLGTTAMANTSNGYLKVLGNSTVTDDLAILGSTTVTDDMAILGSTTVTDDMAILGASGVVTNISAVAGKATEIGRLGTVDAVADMAILGTNAIVTDMAILGSTTVTDDMAILGSTTITDDMALLAVPAVITDMDLLGATGVIDDMALLGVPAVITDMDLLGASGVIGDMDLIGATGVIGDIETVADSIGNVNRYANEYVISGTAPTSPTPTAGDLWYDTSTNVIKYYTGSAFAAITTGMSSLASDTSPELGGALDANNNNFTEVGTISGDNLQIDFGSIA